MYVLVCVHVCQGACGAAVERGVFTMEELRDLFLSMQAAATEAFDLAVEEPKITSREALVAGNSKPLSPSPMSVSSSSSGGSASGDAVKWLVSRDLDTQLRLTGRVVVHGRGGDALNTEVEVGKEVSDKERPEAMRKQMTRVFDELLSVHKDMVYIGEDVQHGGVSQ